MAYTAPNFPNASSPRVYTTQYGKFRGVDFASDPSNVDNSRSPYAQNIISDASGYPEKRLGWRTLRDYEAEISGIHRAVISGKEHIIIHAGTKLYKHGTTPTELYTLATGTSGRSTSFVCDGKLWILTGKEYLVYNGTAITLVTASAHVPTIAIGCTPATGSGKTFESVNLLSASRKKSYKGDGTAAYATEAGISAVTSVMVNGTAAASGDYSVVTTTGVVTFAGGKEPSAPTVTGQDNVIITYTKAASGYADKINKCRICGLFGIGGANSDRVFFSGNPDSPNVDWHCEISYPAYSVDPSYVPDDSFAFIGSDENAIMGYRRIGQYQAVIKAQNDQDATVFLRTGSLDDNNNAIFGIEQGAAGVGAVSMYSFATLKDEPMFLSKTGISGLVNTEVTNTTNIQNRSYYVDSLLLNESNLDNAIAVEWKGFYILCVNTRCYVLDSKQQKTYNAKSGGSYIYECFYWTNIPANVFCEVDGVLYFGTTDGKFCRFNSDISDNTAYNDDGDAIYTIWSTKADDDGDFGRYKSIAGIRGCSIMVKPNTLSSARVYLTTQRAALQFLMAYEGSERFSFEDLDFSDFSFETGDTIQTFNLGVKIKKYVVLQIIIQNNVVDENFGVFKISKHYTAGRLVW